MNTYVPIFQGLDARGGRKLRTDRQTHTRDNYSNPCCACTPRVNKYMYMQKAGEPENDAGFLKVIIIAAVCVAS